MNAKFTGVVDGVNREMENTMFQVVEFMLARYGIVLGDEEGQGLIEYVLIAALISIAAIAAIRIVGPAVSTQFGTVGTALTPPTP